MWSLDTSTDPQAPVQSQGSQSLGTTTAPTALAMELILQPRWEVSTSS